MGFLFIPCWKITKSGDKSSLILPLILPLNLLTCADSSPHPKKKSNLPSIICRLTTICSFRYYESPRGLGDAAAGALLIDRVKQNIIHAKLDGVGPIDNIPSTGGK